MRQTVIHSSFIFSVLLLLSLKAETVWFYIIKLNVLYAVIEYINETGIKVAPQFEL